jgi:hypothetical protein
MFTFLNLYLVIVLPISERSSSDFVWVVVGDGQVAADRRAVALAHERRRLVDARFVTAKKFTKL